MTIENQIPHSSDPQEGRSISAPQNLQGNPQRDDEKLVSHIGKIAERYLALSGIASQMEDLLIGKNELTIDDRAALTESMAILRARTRLIDEEYTSR